jgi:hypothetical protein
MGPRDVSVAELSLHNQMSSRFVGFADGSLVPLLSDQKRRPRAREFRGTIGQINAVSYRGAIKPERATIANVGVNFSQLRDKSHDSTVGIFRRGTKRSVGRIPRPRISNQGERQIGKVRPLLPASFFRQCISMAWPRAPGLRGLALDQTLAHQPNQPLPHGRRRNLHRWER